MALVSFHKKICVLEILYILYIPRPAESRKRFRLALQLQFEGIDVISIYVGVAELDDELSRFGPSDLSNHACEKCVRRDIEGDTEPQVRRPLVHEAGEPRFGVGLGRRRQVDIKLTKEVTRW